MVNPPVGTQVHPHSRASRFAVGARPNLRPKVSQSLYAQDLRPQLLNTDFIRAPGLDAVGRHRANSEFRTADSCFQSCSGRAGEGRLAEELSLAALDTNCQLDAARGETTAASIAGKPHKIGRIHKLSKK